MWLALRAGAPVGDLNPGRPRPAGGHAEHCNAFHWRLSRECFQPEFSHGAPLTQHYSFIFYSLHFISNKWTKCGILHRSLPSIPDTVETETLLNHKGILLSALPDKICPSRIWKVLVRQWSLHTVLPVYDFVWSTVTAYGTIIVWKIQLYQWDCAL